MKKFYVGLIWSYRHLLITGLIGLLILNIGLSFPSPAKASMSQLEEMPGQMLYQSRHTLRDQNGNPWQVVFFKRIKPDQTTQINLRLVDFPGTATLTHPEPLIVITKSGQEWRAADVFAEKAPASNVGQYDLKEIIPQIPLASPLELNLELNEQQRLRLKVPGEIVLEWQDVVQQELTPNQSS